MRDSLPVLRVLHEGIIDMVSGEIAGDAHGEVAFGNAVGDLGRMRQRLQDGAREQPGAGQAQQQAHGRARGQQRDALAFAAGGRVARLDHALALELGPGVRVNAVAPGAILWPEASGNTAAQDAMLARTPLGRTGTPQEVAEAVRWLLQDATYSTGQVLHLDGGRLLGS